MTMVKRIRFTSSAVLALALFATACGDEAPVTSREAAPPAAEQPQDESPVETALTDVTNEVTEEVVKEAEKAATEKAADLLADATKKLDEEKPTAEKPAAKKPTAKKPAAAKAAVAAPEFALPDLDGKEHKLSDYKGKWVVLEWTNHGCPFVKRLYKDGTFQALQKTYTAKDVVWLSICSSGPGKQGHHEPAKWKEINTRKGGNATAVLLDPAGDVGRLFRAKKTPQMFVIDPEGKIAYQGAIDDDPRGKKDTPTNYVAAVLDAGLAGQALPYSVTKPYG